MKRNEIEREEYNAGPSRGQNSSEGCGALFFGGLDGELRFPSGALTLKAGLIVWSSTVHLTQMLSLILSPSSNPSAVSSIFQV